jgi:hypothetical protein
MGLLASAAGLIHYGLGEKQDRIHLCIGMVVFCLLAALASGWAEADALKTFNNQELRQTLTATIGTTATSDFFIGLATTYQAMSLHKSVAFIEMFLLAIYSAFLTKK